MYNARALVDRAGALVERYVYDPYGKPLIRESAARGDFQGNGVINTIDYSVFLAVKAGSLWDPRADLNDDGLVDSGDTTSMQIAKQGIWNSSTAPTVAQAFSDVGNPFMFQGRPNFPIDTALNATTAKNWLNDFRNRFADPTGRWLTRDPIGYLGGTKNLYEQMGSNAVRNLDPDGLLVYAQGWDVPLGNGHYRRHYYEKNGPFSEERYVGYVDYDIDDETSLYWMSRIETLQDFNNTMNNGSAVAVASLNGVLLIGSFLLPGPDDAIWGIVLTKYGVEKLGVVGGKLLQRIISEYRVLDEIRQIYIKKVRELERIADELLAAGMTAEEAARDLYNRRRRLGMEFKNATPEEYRDMIFKRNLNKEGYDEWGPTLPHLIKKHNGDWNEILKSTWRPGPLDGFPGKKCP